MLTVTAAECAGSRRGTALADDLGRGLARCGACRMAVRVTLDGQALPHQQRVSNEVER